MTPVGNTTSKPHRPLAPRVKLTLTPELIASAEQRDSGHCMWAEAVKAAVPGARFVSVDLQTIRFTDPARPLRYTYLTPQRAQVSLVNFDAGVATEPCSVEIKSGQVTKARGFGSAKGSRPNMPEGRKRELRREHGGSETSIPSIIGGATPPTGALTNTHYSGKRRAFGLRLLVR